MTAVNLVIFLLSTMREPHRPNEAHDSQKYTSIYGACLLR